MTNNFRIHHAIANIRARLGGVICAGLMVTGLGFSDGYSQVSTATDSLQSNPQTTYNNLGRYGDQSVSDALLRFNGVYGGPRGEVNLRGVGYNRYRVAVNGQRLANTGLGDRSFDLMGLPADVAARIEWIRVVSADMDADGLAGTINLVTGESMAEGRSLSLRVGGGANPSYYRLTGPMGRGALHYSDRLTETISLGFSLSYQQEYRGWEGVNTQFASRDFGMGSVDVIERVSPFVETEGRERLGGSVNLLYKPEDAQLFYIRAFFNNSKRDLVNYFDAWNANDDWISPEETGQLGGRGSYQQVAELGVRESFQHSLQTGGNVDFNFLKLDFNLGWTRAFVENSEYTFPFILTARNMDIDMSNRFRPSMVVNNFNLQADGSIDRQFMIMQNIERKVEDHTHNGLTGRVDATVPLGMLQFKVGLATAMDTKTGTYSDASLQFVRILRLNRFNFMRERNFEILDNSYDLPWLLNTEDGRRFVESQRPQFIRNENVFRQRSEIWNYDVTEQVHAGYGLADVSPLTGLNIKAGVRAEMTNIDATGRLVEFSPQGAFVSSTNRDTTESYLDIFPNVQIAYSPFVGHSLFAAYSRTIQRPDYNVLAPFELVNPNLQRIFKGNTALKPEYSNNLDVMYRFKSAYTHFDAGFFTKEIENLVYEQETILVGGDTDGWSEVSFGNSAETASVYGVELGLHQSLAFLPGILGSFGVGVNYTWTETAFTSAQRNEETRLPGHIPHVVNSSLSFAKGRFFVQITHQWSSEMVVEYAQMSQIAPSISATEEVYLDQYRNGWNDVSLSASFRISPQFRFWVDAYNLMATEYVNYQNTRNLYPIATEFNPGRSFVMGVRYDL
jgi:TonB-dependent receptor